MSKKEPEPTGSGTLLSFAAFLHSKRKNQDRRFSRIEPLSARGPNLFDIGSETLGQTRQFASFLQVTDRRLITL